MHDIRPTLRFARLGDCAAIESLMRKAIDTRCVRDYSTEQIAAVRRHFGFGLPDEQLIRDVTYFAAEMGGRLAGCGGWTWRTAPYDLRNDDTGVTDTLPHPTPGRAALRAIFVDPDMGGRGIGQLLVRTAEAAARKLGYDTFEIVATLTGVPLYRKAEYRMHGRYSLALPRGGSFPIAFMSRSDRDSTFLDATEACGTPASRRFRHPSIGLL